MITRSCFCLCLCLCILSSCSPLTESSSQQLQISLEQLDTQSTTVPPDQLQNRIQSVLKANLENRRLSADDNAAWQIMHAVLCYGREVKIETSDRGLVSALDYALSNGQIRGFELMRSAEKLTTTGRYGVKSRFNPGDYIGQGHVDQWLAICAMADIPINTVVTIGQDELTLLDWARQAQFDVPKNPVNEFSWTLIALTHYLPDEPSWQAADELTVSWEQLIEEELRYDLHSSACGGTHRMAGIVRALNAKRRLGLPDSPVWQRAQALVEELLVSVKENRGADGRLSSFYFTRAGETIDLGLELNSTGHMFEFVALAAPADELRQAWIEICASHLCDLLEATADSDLECGALYHALNGLRIYYERRFGRDAA
ncbi:MAG: hypothetical protein NXI32_17810 [bacterium]|nr:hypothetical protein [bacterium]